MLLISILLVVRLFVNCVALNTPIRFADVGVNVEPPDADIIGDNVELPAVIVIPLPAVGLNVRFS